jgi:ribonuclease P protein subunit RPR2
MKRMRESRKGVEKAIARDRIRALYKLAEEAQMKDRELAKYYVKLLKRISMHYKVSIEKSIKNRICKKCGSVLIPGKNVKVRLASANGCAVYKCDECGRETRIRYRLT